MNHRQTIHAVARRLPHLRRHQVAEVLEVTAEVWAEELATPGGTVALVNLGRLYVETQQMQLGGAVRDKIEVQRGTAPKTIQRLYYRFRPAGWLRESVEEQHETQEI